MFDIFKFNIDAEAEEIVRPLRELLSQDEINEILELKELAPEEDFCNKFLMSLPALLIVIAVLKVFL
jgi:hypothetical protein